MIYTLKSVFQNYLPPAIFSAKSVTICVKLTGPGDSESMLLASPEEMDLPTAANALTKSSSDKRPFLSQSMIPKASLNSWICLCENMAKMFEPLFLAFLVIRKLVIRYIHQITVTYYQFMNFKCNSILIGIYPDFDHNYSSFEIFYDIFDILQHSL